MSVTLTSFAVSLLALLVNSFSVEDHFYCQVKYEGSALIEDEFIDYSWTATPTTNPVEPYCSMEKSENWDDGLDQTEIECNQKFCASIIIVTEMDFVPRVSYVSINCSSEQFPLDVQLDPNILMVEDLSLRFGNVDQTAYWIEINLPERRSIKYGADFSGNYTFCSKTDPSFNITIVLDLEVNNFPSDPGDNPPIAELLLYNDYLQCTAIVRGEEIETPYLATIGGKNPKHTELLHPCLYESTSCKNKIIATGTDTCNNTARPCMMVEGFHSHGAALCVTYEKEELKQYFTSINGYDVFTDESAFWDEKNIIELGIDDGLEVLPVENENVPVNNVITVYETQNVTLECKLLDYLLQGVLIWSVVYSNKTEMEIGRASLDLNNEKKVYFKPDNFVHRTKELIVTSSIKNVTASPGMTAVKCSATFWNSSDLYAAATLQLDVISWAETSPPTFEKSAMLQTKQSTKLGSKLTLNCTADDVLPLANYTWEMPPALSDGDAGLNITNSSDGRSSILTIAAIAERHDGEYICTAKNFRGEAKYSFDVSISPEMSPFVYLGIIIAVTVILGAVIGIISRMYYLQRGRLTVAEIKLFENGDLKALKSGESMHINAMYLPYIKKYEVKWHDFHISEEKLGEGAYGIVFKGYIKKEPDTKIAIKTVKPGVEKQVILALLSELKIMIALGKHANLVEIKGACTEFLRAGRVYVMVEYCPMGSLEAFLQDNKGLYSHTKAQKAGMYLDNGSSPYKRVAQILPDEQQELCFGSEDLVNWSTQIAKGMQYLTEKKVIHGDLATRNVLLVSKHHVKISDFGLSCQLKNYKTYVTNNYAKLPWRWLPPETLKTSTFTHKSDVWSFGVLLWEIFSLGDLPYSGLEWTSNFVLYLENNLRPSKPFLAPESIYKIMYNCWATDPSLRPDFHQLELEFKDV